MEHCKTCKHWQKPGEDAGIREDDLCTPRDPDTYKPMDRGFEVRLCKEPTQAFCESPVKRDGFALTDGSTYMAAIATAEDFGCVLHEQA